MKNGLIRQIATVLCVWSIVASARAQNPPQIDAALIRSSATFLNCASSDCAQTLTVEDLNGVPGLQCPGCVDGKYTFSDVVDLWALMYGGLHHDGTVDCGGDVRYTIAGVGHPDGGYESGASTALVSYWENFFQDCADEACGSHQHLWRPGDDVEVTQMFMALTGISSFCNGTDTENLDPIRRDCFRKNNQQEDICEIDGTNGLLLPVVPLPEEVSPNSNLCAPGVFRWSPGAYQLRPGCEDGSDSAFGMCLVPVDANGGAGCISPVFNRSMFTPLSSDTRSFNLVLRAQNGSVLLDGAGREISAAYFRMHEVHTSTPGASFCRESRVEDQIDCLIQASACSTGFARRDVSHLFGIMEMSLCEGAVIITPPPINMCPEVSSLNAAPIVIGVGGVSHLSAVVYDADNDPLSHRWTATSGTFSDPFALSAEYTCAEAGHHTIAFTVEDPHNCIASEQVPIVCR